MKYGLMTYRLPHRYINIGDYIQSLASKQFLPNVDILINREELSKFDETPVKLIMNGWFMHNPKTWPPSSMIEPLLISVHINRSKSFILEQDDIIDFLKKNAPVGCRDYETLELLKRKNIDSYLSSCLTLTLSNKYEYKGERCGVYLVDPFFNFPVLTDFLLNTKRTVANLISGKIKLKDFLLRRKYLNKIFDKKLLKQSTKITHVFKNRSYSEEELFKEAEKLVEIYSKAELVITSRIHCALPCLALNTPVIFLDAGFNDENEQSRLKGIQHFFNVISIDKNENVVSDIDFKNKFNKDVKIQNKMLHLKYKDILNANVESFIKNNNL